MNGVTYTSVCDERLPGSRCSRPFMSSLAGLEIIGGYFSFSFRIKPDTTDSVSASKGYFPVSIWKRSLEGQRMGIVTCQRPTSPLPRRSRTL